MSLAVILLYYSEEFFLKQIEKEFLRRRNSFSMKYGCFIKNDISLIFAEETLTKENNSDFDNIASKFYEMFFNDSTISIVENAVVIHKVENFARSKFIFPATQDFIDKVRLDNLLFFEYHLFIQNELFKIEEEYFFKVLYNNGIPEVVVDNKPTFRIIDKNKKQINKKGKDNGYF